MAKLASPRRIETLVDETAEPSDAVVDTRARILEAAFQRLAREGYAALSVREIAKDAGLNHALINYYFGTKERLVVEVFEEANRQRLARQTSMYRGEGGFAHKWQQARTYYAGDLESGYVRVLIELLVASLSDPALRELMAPRVGRWRQIIQETARSALDAAAERGVKLPAKMTDAVIATWIVAFWIGMEVFDLFGREEDRRHHRDALDAVQDLLELLDAQASLRTPPMKNRAGSGGKPHEPHEPNESAPSGDVPPRGRPAPRGGKPAPGASKPLRHGRAGK